MIMVNFFQVRLVAFNRATQANYYQTVWKINRKSDLSTIRNIGDGHVRADSWPSYAVYEFALHYLINYLLDADSYDSDPVHYAKLQIFLQDLFIRYSKRYHSRNMMQIAGATLLVGIICDDYSLWTTLVFFVIKNCKHRVDEYGWERDDPSCIDLLQETAEKIVQFDDEMLIKKFIAALDTNAELADGIQAICDHIVAKYSETGMCQQLILYGGDSVNGDHGVLQQFKAKLDMIGGYVDFLVQ